MSARPCIAFDLDEVLCGIRGLCAEAFSRRTGINVPWTEWRFYEMYRIYGLSLNRAMDIIVEERIIERAPIEPYAAETVNTALEAGYRTAIVTSREYHPDGKGVTIDWLRQKNLEIDEVHLAGVNVTKSDVLLGIGNVVAYIDDYPPHLDHIARTGAAEQTFVLSRRWNQQSWGHRRMDNLRDFKAVIESLPRSTAAISSRSSPGRAIHVPNY